MKIKKVKTSLIMTLIMLMVPVFLMAQELIVSGIVTDAESKKPLTGVSVFRKDLQGAVTDTNGKYSIQVKKGELLLFCYKGFITKQVTVKKSILNVALKKEIFTETEVLSEEPLVVKLNRQNNNNKQAKIVYCMDIAYAPPMVAPANYNTEEYATFTENRFKPADKEPLSTFSIDIDAASYSNMRRFINQGQLPPQDAIRTEELINYFSYNYPRPSGKDPVHITTESGTCPWNTTHRLIRIGIKAKEMAGESLPASNLVFLIDVSGSMYGAERLELIKSSLKLLINNLREKDRVAIVVYAGAAGEILSSTPGNDKQKIREALDNLTAGGSTAGGEGIKLAYSIARKNFIKEGNNRIILCTDGDFNVGISDDKALEKMIENERKSGVFLTVLGYGMGNYKDKKMQVLAEKGNGNHAYIDNMQEANKILVNEFGATLYTVAKDVKLQVEFNPAKVQAYRLIGYESRLLANEDFNDDTKDAGEIGAGHTVTALYEVVPVGVKGNIPGSIDNLKYQQISKNFISLNYPAELLTVKLRYKDPDSNNSKKIEVPLVDNQKNEESSDFYFVSAVAMFSQLLRDSDFKGNADYTKVITTAKKGLENDSQGYRREFIRLVEAVSGISK